MMIFNINDIVRHNKFSEYGIGKILDVDSEDNENIYKIFWSRDSTVFWHFEEFLVKANMPDYLKNEI